jgi:hypothetical protein
MLTYGLIPPAGTQGAALWVVRANGKDISVPPAILGPIPASEELPAPAPVTEVSTPRFIVQTLTCVFGLLGVIAVGDTAFVAATSLL